jgi:hypothetical protein
MRLLTRALAILLVGGIDAAAASSCLEEVQRLAQAHDLSTDPPAGVIEPPRTPDGSVITPPRNVDPGMTTMPRGAADRTTLQSILTAARAQAERGAESHCREQLDKAHRLIERSGA